MTRQAIGVHLNKAKLDQNTSTQIDIECSQITASTSVKTTTDQPDNEQGYLLDMSVVSSR